MDTPLFAQYLEHAIYPVYPDVSQSNLCRCLADGVPGRMHVPAILGSEPGSAASTSSLLTLWAPAAWRNRLKRQEAGQETSLSMAAAEAADGAAGFA